MRKIIVGIFCMMCLLSLSACGSSNSSQGVSESSANVQASQESEEVQASQEEKSTEQTASETQNGSEAEGETTSENATDETTQSGNGKTLVVYFSATGTTKTVANYIASATGADVFEIVPKEAYTDEDLDYTDDNSRVVREYNNESERTVALQSETVGNWDEYDTVFIGYPIWWGIAAWPASSFVELNDFTGKTVIPFCTSVSSDLGDSGTLLSEAAGAGNWQEGQRFSSGTSEDDVKTWLESIGY